MKLISLSTIRRLGCLALAICDSSHTVLADASHPQDDAFYAAAAALLPAYQGVPAPVDPAESQNQGGWGNPISLPHVPVTAANLPDGRVLTYASNQRTSFPNGPEFTYAAVFDPDTGTVTERNWNQHDMFCGGTVLRPDGKLQVMGGRNIVKLSSTFDWTTNTWTRVGSMNDPRWYTTSVALPNGEVFTVSGSGGPNSAERFNGTAWLRLTGIDWSPIANIAATEADWTPMVFMAPNGKLFHAGPTKDMNWVDPTGVGSLTPAGLQVPGTWYPKDAAVAMYDVGKILIAGGLLQSTTAETPTNSSFTVDLNTTPPAITQIAPMASIRRFANAITMPSGEVLVIGGNTSGQKFSDVGSVLGAEIWNPRTGAWRQVADMAVPRNYHSVALMLADGRILSGGGGLAGSAAVDHTDIQLYSPPGLFTSTGTAATRPVLNTAPGSIGLTGRFTVTGTAGLRKFAFIRMTSITHGMTADQRYISLPFTEISPGNYELSPHPNRYIMTPGYWMLYGIDANGVHGKAKIIKVDEAATVALAGTNLAPGKIVSQSSTPDANRSANRAVDGQTNGNFTVAPGSSTASETGAFWEIDLQADYALNAVRISTRTDVGNSVLKDFSVYASSFPFAQGNTDIRSYRHYTAAGPQTVINLYRNARYLRIQLNGTDALHLAEVEILGNPTPVSSLALQNPGSQFSERGAGTSLQLLSTQPLNASFSASGLPAGLTLNATSGLISGTPTTLGQSTVNISAALPNGSNSSQSFTWTIHPPSERPGVLFDYYEGNWTSLPDFNALAPTLSGETADFNLTPKLRSDNFALFYRGCFRLATAGSWTFYTNSDDASQIWIDGQLVVDHNGIHTASEKSATISLTAGIHSISVGYLQSTGASSLAISYAGPGVAKQALAGSALFQPRPGVRYDYYEGVWNAVPNFSVITPVKSGNIDNFSLTPRVANTFYAFRFRANLRVPTAGVYTFYTNSDEGSLLWIDGTQVVNNNGLHTLQEASGQITLTAGTHEIIVGYVQQSNDAVLTVSYAGPGIAKQAISAGAMSTHGLPGLPPVIDPIANQTSQLGNAVNLNVVASDANGDTLSYSATGLPGGLAINSATGVISGTPDTQGVFSPIITVNDGTGRSISASFTWTVLSQLTLQPLASLPKTAGTAISYSVISAGGNNPRFKWSFGDGTAETPYAATRTISKTFASPGRYQVLITATDDSGVVLTASFYQAIYGTLTAKPPVSSSALAYEVRASGGDRVWNVNPDQDTVTAFNASTNVKSLELAVGDQPVSIAQAPDGRLWVVNKKSATISIINPATNALAGTLNLPRASRPHGLAFSPTADGAYVALEATGKVLKLHPANGSLLGSVDVGADVRHLTVSANGSKVYVSRFISPTLPGESTATVQTTIGAVNYGGEVVVINPATMTKTNTIILKHSERPDAENGGRGIPNYLGPPVLSPDGLTAWVPSKQDNIKRGTLRSGGNLTHDSTVRSIASRLVLAGETEDSAARIDFDDSGTPSTALYDLTGTYLFVALEGSREVAVVDAFNKQTLLKFDAGRAPQGLMISPDNTRLMVHNFMDRTVTVHDISSILNGGSPLAAQIPLLATWQTVATEALPASVLKGKQFFYDARDPRMALQNYISCASCHNDGGHDGRTWDFTGLGEGLRNTTDLRGKSGTNGQGPAHWTGNFDEIQDFEKQIRDLSRGTGLMADAQFNSGTRNQPLGTPKAGLSADLDALAAYVTSLTVEDPSPYRNSDGTLTTAAVAGKEIFRAANCASCHAGNQFTDSAVNLFHDVGTLKSTSGKRLGATLTGLDTPTLRGVWGTAPYLHDGSASTLSAAVTAHTGVNIAPADLPNLVAYLQQIDPSELTAPVPTISGLKGEYFFGPTPGLTVPLLTRSDATIDFAWGGGSPAPSVPIDNFSARWTGFLTAPYTETYTIFTPADDGLRIWINNVLVMDKWPVPQNYGWPSFTIALTAGQRVPIKVEYSETYGGASISLYWFSNSQPWEAISKFSPPDFTNHAPVLTTPPTQTTVRTTSATLAILAVDEDGDALTYATTGLPAGLSIHPTTGVISGTVGTFAANTNTVTITATDAGNLTASTTFTWTTTAPPTNRPPVINAPGSQSFIRGTIASLTLLASDPDGQALTWSAVNLPPGLSINSTNGLISGTVSLTAPDTGTATITVTDPGNLTASTTFAYTTSPPPLNGLKGEYFDGLTPGAGTLLMTRTDPTLNFDWGSGSPAPTIPVDYFSVRWTGDLVAPYTETYNFSLPSDNGVRVWINNVLVLDKWSPNDAHGWYNFSAPLTANVRTPIKIEYFELWGGATISLYWYSVRQSWEIIDPSHLYPAPTAPTGSVQDTINLVAHTQDIIDVGNGERYLAFVRPSASAGSLALIVEQSTDLIHWSIDPTPALIFQENNGQDYIYVPLPAGQPGAPHRCYYRIRFAAPPQYTTHP